MSEREIVWDALDMAYDRPSEAHWAFGELVDALAERDRTIATLREERDAALHQRDNFERIAREQAEGRHELWLWRGAAERRVAALMEAADGLIGELDDDVKTWGADHLPESTAMALDNLRAALAEWPRNRQEGEA